MRQRVCATVDSDGSRCLYRGFGRCCRTSALNLSLHALISSWVLAAWTQDFSSWLRAIRSSMCLRISDLRCSKLGPAPLNCGAVSSANAGAAKRIEAAIAIIAVLIHPPYIHLWFIQNTKYYLKVY